MKKRTFIIALLMAATMAMRAQLTLDSCLRMARANYPAIRQYSLVEASRQFSMSNAAKGYLPQVSVSGTAAAFTDPVDLGALGDVDNTLYNIGLTVKQNIYDGGAIAAKRRIAQAQAAVESRRIDVTMYDVEGRVEELFFGILVVDAQIDQVATLISDLQISQQTVQTMMTNGVANQSDVDAVSVEIVRARQKDVSLMAVRKAYEEMLLRYIGPSISLPLPPLTPPEAPSNSPRGGELLLAKDLNAEQNPSQAIHTNQSLPHGGRLEGASSRPELSYYAAQRQLLDERRRSLDIGLRPQLSAFGTAMYHNKPLQMMKNSMFAVGLSLNWNIGALYTRKNDIRNIENERLRIGTEQDVFLFNNSLQASQSQGQIDNLRQQLKLDDDIVALRESIRSKAERKVELGTETVNEMLRDINAASEARCQRDIHAIELMKETYNYNRIKGE